MKVVVCGGGNIGHGYGKFLHENGIKDVTLFSKNAAAIKSGLASTGAISVVSPDGGTFKWRPAQVSSDPVCVRGADSIIVTNSLNDRKRVLRVIAPYLSETKEVLVGAVPAWGGFDWMCDKYLGKRDNIVVWGLKDVPFIASRVLPGTKVTIGGMKSFVYFAVKSKTQSTRTLIKKMACTSVEEIANFLAITATPGNPIEHIPILFSLFGPFGSGKPLEAPPYFYEDMTPLSAYLMEKADLEQIGIIKKLGSKYGFRTNFVKPLHADIVELYGDQIEDSRTLLSTYRTNAAFSGIKVPMVKSAGGWVADKTHRVFTEDVPYGLKLLLYLGKKLGMELPIIAELAEWADGFCAGCLDGAALDYLPTRIDPGPTY